MSVRLKEELDLYIQMQINCRVIDKSRELLDDKAFTDTVINRKVVHRIQHIANNFFLELC